MRYLTDTVTLVRYLQKPSQLGKQAHQILQEATDGQHTVFISALNLMEILYLAQAKRITVNLVQVLEIIANQPNFEWVPIDANVVLAAAMVDDVPELHDRILVGTAKYLQVPLLTCDRIITQSRHVQTIWE